MVRPSSETMPMLETLRKRVRRRCAGHNRVYVLACCVLEATWRLEVEAPRRLHCGCRAPVFGEYRAWLFL